MMGWGGKFDHHNHHHIHHNHHHIHHNHHHIHHIHHHNHHHHNRITYIIASSTIPMVCWGRKFDAVSTLANLTAMVASPVKYYQIVNRI